MQQVLSNSVLDRDDRDGQEGLPSAVDAADDFGHHRERSVAIIFHLLHSLDRESEHGLCTLDRRNLDHCNVATNVGLFHCPRHGDRPARFHLQQDLSAPAAILQEQIPQAVYDFHDSKLASASVICRYRWCLGLVTLVVEERKL